MARKMSVSDCYHKHWQCNACMQTLSLNGCSSIHATYTHCWHAPHHTHLQDLLPMCYRCSNTNPLLNNAGNFCVNCKQPFEFSFVSFGERVLVQWQLECLFDCSVFVEYVSLAKYRIKLLYFPVQKYCLWWSLFQKKESGKKHNILSSIVKKNLAVLQSHECAAV